MMLNSVVVVMFPAMLALYVPACPTPVVRPTTPSDPAPMMELWEEPRDLPTRALFDGPWGLENAPDPGDTYSFVRAKQRGTNPGVVVKDSRGREWHVKQPAHGGHGDEGPVEVVLSRVLSAVGYHQPPVYFLPSFTLHDGSGVHSETGGRFRLHTKSLKDTGQWSWQQNPFVGTKPYQGLLVILMMFDSSDLKNDNNTLYEVTTAHQAVETWYVVQDLGTSLGETGRLDPKRGDAEIFARQKFIKGVKGGFVEFNYHGWHQELVRRRITPSDVGWACTLLSSLSDQQWRDAFRAGGYGSEVAERFIRRLQQKIVEGQQLANEYVQVEP